MTICYFGDYDPGYSRNRVIIDGLRKNGVTVHECRVSARYSFFKKACLLFKDYGALKEGFDAVIVGYSDSRSMVMLAKFLRPKKLIWDAFYSLYDGWVLDRKLVAAGSAKAKAYWMLDRLNCIMADRVLLDTEEHIKFFVSTFKLKREKFIKVLVGSSALDFGIKSEKKKDGMFRVFFYGNFIPLQGVEYIVRAADLLKGHKDILFIIQGGGQTYGEIKKLADGLSLENMIFKGRADYKELLRNIAGSDICLGIFGNTGKARRVIPNKVYDAVAMGKPVITGDSPAIRELFEDGENILLCKLADEKSLAEKISAIKSGVLLKKTISDNAYKTFVENCLPEIVVRELINNIAIKG